VSQAQQYLGQGVRSAIRIGDAFALWNALPAWALLLAEQNLPERAVELYALAPRYPYVANSAWFAAVAGPPIAAAAATLPPQIVAAAQERGQARELWATAEELLVTNFMPRSRNV
jgi:hypothetical protein